jgi:hypothetical protein
MSDRYPTWLKVTSPLPRVNINAPLVPKDQNKYRNWECERYCTLKAGHEGACNLLYVGLP